MKSKPVKHKTTNTFRFIPFAERINNIDIRHAALYHVEHANIDQPEENETHFHVALRKWFSLNLTESFKKFRKEVFGIVTLPQLVHRKDDVLKILERYLKLEEQACLQPLLEILVGLAKDLREDFYPHFPKFLDILIQLLETKDAEKLEWTLLSLAFLFKILKPYLKRDLAAVLKRIIPLLSEKKPQYINNFAAESFAFVARDIRDKKKFINLIASYLTTHEDAISGCGHLLFEIIRGVPGKFHSCVESFIPLLLQHLIAQKDHQNVLFKVLTQTIQDSLQAVSHKEYKVFWDSITKYAEEILKEEDDENKGLEYILRLAGQVIEHNNGKYLHNPPEFVLLLIKVICEQSSEDVLEVCAQIGALLLLSSNITLSQEHAGIIVKVLLPLPFPNILINFVKNVIEYSQFDMHILPHFLNFVVQSNFDSEAMNTLTKICLRKSPLSKNGIQLFEWVKYPIDFGRGLPLFQKYLDTVLSDSIDNIMDNPKNLINILICLPHVEKIDVNHILAKLRGIVSSLLKILSGYNIETQKQDNKYHTNTSILSKGARKILFIVGNAIECAVHISSCKGIKEFYDIDKLLLILLPCAVDPNYLAALHVLDLYLTAYEHENGLRMPLLSLIDSYLRENLCSPFHVVRLLTTHIYKLFENIEEMKKSGQVGSATEQLQVFSLCYNVEAVKPSIQEYRTQLNMLQKMAFNTAQYALLKETSFSLHALIYMMGVLYMNFKLLWEPVTEFIAGYGNALPADEFWPVFQAALQSSFDNANKDLKQFNFNDELEANQAHIHEIYADYSTIDERPDLPNYRNLILNIMTQCPQVCEAKNRDVVPIFLNFIDNQYRREDKMNALKADLEEHVKTVEEEPAEDENIENMDIVEVEDQKETLNGKIIFKTLINVMQVLAHFKNPRALYRETEFWDIFMDFLRNKNPGLQKYALDCVMNYKIKNLLPYKDHLYNLVDEKKFKDEMTLFKITEDSQSIHQEDREQVIPIIIRILYGKMTSKLGADKKGGGQTRRSLVMRYLAGCNENELKLFFDMAFSHMQQYLTMSPKEIYNDIKDKLDLKAVTSPGKLHSTLNLFEVVREYFGGYMKEDLLRHIFKTFYALSSTIAVVLSKDNVHVGYVKVMKNLRIVALSIIRKLFEQFDKYKWDTEELDVIFNTLIWPLLTKLYSDGIHSPTALLKVLNTWCLNPRYYILLITHPENDRSQTPINGIFKLLLNPKTSVNVVNVILDMIEKLLTLIEDDVDKESPPIQTSNSLQVNVVTTQKNINFGSKILIPHISDILEVMKRRIANSAKSNTVNKRDLLILSRVTELVSTPELCDELLNLLLPILVKKVCMNMAEENMEYAITTIINLLNHSKVPHVYIKNIAVLFNKVTLVEVRKLLLNTLRSIAANSPENKEVLNRLADVITEMNAFNKRWIDQPDFDRRLDAYKEIYRLSESNEIDIDLAILIVNNCFYFVRTEKDIGLRDSAGLCLKRILPKLMLKYRSAKNGDVFVRDTVLSLISNGIRDNKSEIHRNEAISLLGELVRECPDADVVLSDLAPLINKDDVEVDFFENMCHLQMHRHVRALLKFSKVFKKVVKCPTPRTITNFILPLATMYVCDDKYTDKNTLIDACIEVISTSCRLLPWYHYEVILKLYLNKLRHTTEHQKQLTRILVGILDAFHFDFSKVKDIELPKSLTNNLDIGNIAKKKVKVEKEPKNKEGTKEHKIKETEDNEMEIETTKDTNEQDVDLAPEIDENIEQTIDETQVDDKLQQADEEEGEESLQPQDLITPAFERVTTVSPSVAKRIIKSLAAGLLPQLSRSIGRMTDHEESHKLNRRKHGLERQEQDMQRVPIALALVKLLQRLPGDVLRYHLAGIIIKLCSFLKSPLKQVRIAARDIVKKIMTTVGTSYLEILLQHLTMLLTRGFQVHVLVATIHVVLDALKAEFKPGEIDKCLTYILDVCSNDLFGALSEEKEVDKLGHKTPEAKPSKKSYVSLMIVAQNITDKVLIKLLLPFKDVLQKHHSKKVVMKVQEALTHISAGLVTNKFLNIESLFVFLHGIASESIPEFVLGVPKREITEAQKAKMLIARPDCFIIPVAPKRNKEVQAKHVKTSARANAHVLVEFSLNILYVILKREKVPRANCVAFVDPLIPILVDSLKSDHVKVTTVAMKCLSTLWTIRISTPTLTESIKDIVRTIFTMLHKYATFEISKQNDNFNLVRNAFKAVTVLIRNVKYFTIETDQLKTLLLYAEEDCLNDERQNTSFTLLKAILDAKLVSPELHEVMEKVAKICILSESYKTREEARQIFVTYITNYTPGKKMEKYIQFFVSQLNYELQHGRESALKFLDMIIHKFQVPQLSKQSDYLLLSLAACMVNDPAPECRSAAAASIENMLDRFPAQDRNKLFDLVLTFFQDTQPIHIELAAQLSIRFVNIEKEDFKTRLPTLLPTINSKTVLLSNDLSEGRFVKLQLDQSEDKTDEEKQKEKDHSLIQLLNLIDRISTECSSVLKNSKYFSEWDDIAQQCQILLAYPHSWVRIRAAKIISHILSTVDGTEIEDVIKGRLESDRGFVYYDTENTLRSLVLDLCAQYTPGVSKDMAEQVTSVLFQILKLIHSIPSFKVRKKLQATDIDSEGGGRVNIRWITFKMKKAINAEVAKAPLTTNIRESIFTTWMHLISLLDPEDLHTIIDVILSPLVRELSTGDAAAPASLCRQLATRLGKKLRRKIGDIEYGKLAADAQTKLNIKRAERKKLILQEKVHNPEKAAKRKLQVKEKKKIAKKAKMEMVQGKRPRAKKRKAADIDLEDELLKDD